MNQFHSIPQHVLFILQSSASGECVSQLCACACVSLLQSHQHAWLAKVCAVYAKGACDGTKPHVVQLLGQLARALRRCAFSGISFLMIYDIF